MNQLQNTRDGLNRAFSDYEQERYASCLFEASKVKAEIDVVLSTFGANNLEDILSIKIEGAKHSLLNAQRKGIFPLISYSYYEYAQSLQEDDPVSALLFVEYALELSNVDIYFTPRKPVLNVDVSLVVVLVVGIVLGVILFKVVSRKGYYKTLANARKRLRGKKR